MEISPYGLRFRKKRALCLATLPAHALPLLEVPYEFRAAKDWGKGASVPVVPVDLCSVSKGLLRQAHAFMRNPSPPLMDYRSHLLLAKRCWEDPTLARLYARTLHPKRERALAKRIWDLFHRHRGKKVLHIAGWIHLLDAPGTLYRLLSALNPRRILLDPEGEG